MPRERTGAETEAEERTSLLVAPPHGGGGGGGGHTGAVIALAACGDGRVVSGSDDMTIKVWNTGCEDRAGGRAGDMGDAGAGGGAWELEQTLTDHTGFVVVLAVLYSDGGSGGGSDGGDTRSGGSGSGGGGGGGDGSLAGIIGEGGGVCEALFKFDSSGNDHEDEDNSGGNCSGNSSGKNKHRDLRRPRRILFSGSFDATIKAWSDDINPWSDAAGSGGGAGAGAGGGAGSSGIGLRSEPTSPSPSTLTGAHFRCERTLTGHTGPVEALTFTMCDDDDRATERTRLVSGGWDRTIRVWNVTSLNPAEWTCERSIAGGHTGEILTLATLCGSTLYGGEARRGGRLPRSDRRWVVAGSSDQNMSVWDMSAGEAWGDRGAGKALHAVVRGAHTNDVVDLMAWGSTLASSCNDRSVRIWESSNLLNEQVEIDATAEEESLAAALAAAAVVEEGKVGGGGGGGNEGATTGGTRTWVVAMAEVFAAGDRITVRFNGGDDWFNGRVAKVNNDGTYDVDYDDGDEETHVVADLMRPRGGGGGKRGNAGTDDAGGGTTGDDCGDAPFATLRGHSGEAYALVSCGETLVSGSQDGTLRVWRRRSGACAEGGGSGGKGAREGARQRKTGTKGVSEFKCVRTLLASGAVCSLCVCGDKLVAGLDDGTMAVYT